MGTGYDFRDEPPAFDESDQDILNQLEMGMEEDWEESKLDEETQRKLEENPLYHTLNDKSKEQLAETIQIDRDAGMEPNLDASITVQKLMQDGRDQEMQRKDRMFDNIMEHLKTAEPEQISEGDRTALDKIPGYNGLSEDMKDALNEVVNAKEEQGMDVNLEEEVEQAQFFDNFGTAEDYLEYENEAMEQMEDTAVLDREEALPAGDALEEFGADTEDLSL